MCQEGTRKEGGKEKENLEKNETAREKAGTAAVTAENKMSHCTGCMHSDSEK